MSGLRRYRRDAALLGVAGDAALTPPSEAALLELTRAHLLRPGAPHPVEATWEYARWKPRTSLTAGYALAWPDGSRRWVSWKRYADGKAARLADRRDPVVSAEAADALLAESALLPDQGVHLWALPFDRELPGLERASDLRRTKRFLLEEGLFPGRRVRSASSRVEVVRYKPERRAVLRLDLRLRPLEGGEKTSERLAARALPPAEALRVIAARTRWQAERPDDLAPPLVACEPRTGLLLEPWLPVEPFAPDAFGHAGLAGELLGRLHRAPVGPAPASPPAGVQGALELFALEPQVARAARGLAVDPTGPARPAAWIHGDFHPDQVALEAPDGRALLLDLDRLGVGDPLGDLATWTADRLARDPHVDLRAASGDLLAGYARGGGAPPDGAGLAEACAAALVRLAAGALRRLEHDAAAKASRLLERARDLAPRGRVFA